MKRLSELLRDIHFTVLQGDPEVGVTGIEQDSRRIKPGDLFLCVPGQNHDGHNFARQAAESGAIALMAERPVSVPPGCTVVQVDNCRRLMPVLAARFYSHPARELRVIGVTGTNGKTTTSHLIKAVLEEYGHKVGLMGTLYANVDDYEEVLNNTTPESLDIQRLMRLALDRQANYFVMEVSSHALDLGRVEGINFSLALFTNLTQDHLDYHGTLEEYRQAKLKLFDALEPGDNRFAVLNADDPSFEYFRSATKADVITYGLSEDADVRALNPNITMNGSLFTVVYPGGEIGVKINLAGLFNVYNSLGAFALALKEGIPPEVIKAALEKIQGVPGRFEIVNPGQDYSVIVDYAHTPDGLENVLKTARQIAKRRVITVFGCGGNRDRTKRPIMGKIAAQYSDFTIITSDNPRMEEPMDIINDILPGVLEVEGVHYAVVPDRREAIHHAVELVGKDDIVIIAGKGHENYQLIKGKVYPFDDREVARECIKKKERI